MSARRHDSVCLLLVCGVLFTFLCVSGFQSDELQEEEEEWGIVRGSSGIEQVTARSRPVRSHQPSTESSTPPSSDSKVVFQLEHSLVDSTNFRPAGTFSARLRNSHHGGQTLTKLRLSRNPFTTQEQETFEELVKADSWYRIRIPANVLNPGQEMILSSVKARCLSAANLEERFDFYLDRGNVIAVGYGVSDCTYPRALTYPKKWTFESHIVLKSGEQAVRSVEISSDTEVELGEDGQPKKLPEKSFWGKYWMYIVPLALIVLNAITQVANMPEESGGAQGGAPQRQVSAGLRRR